MAWSLVQQVGINRVQFNTSVSVTPGSNVTAGNMLVAFVACETDDIISVSDSGSNTWTKIVNSSAYWRPAIWFASNVAAVTTSGSITATVSNNHQLILHVVEFSGGGTSPTVNASNVSQGGSLPAVSATIAAAVGDLIVGLMSTGTDRTYTATAPGIMIEDGTWTATNHGNPGLTDQYYEVASGTTASMTWTLATGSNSDYFTAIASITPSGAGGATVAPQLPALGVG